MVGDLGGLQWEARIVWWEARMGPLEARVGLWEAWEDGWMLWWDDGTDRRGLVGSLEWWWEAQ